MNQTQSPLLAWENNWKTTLGAWFAGERVVVHGENILDTMRGKSWLQMILFCATGRHIDRKSADLLDEVLAFSGCIPDPRLWNNRVAVLAGSVRSHAVSSVSAATAASEAVIFGFQPTVGAHHLLLELAQGLEAGKTLEDLLSGRLASRKKSGGGPARGANRSIDCLPGFGRPVTSRDERIEPIMQLLTRYNAGEGAAVKLAWQVEETLQSMGYKRSLNTAGLLAAIVVDQGLTAQELVYYTTQCFCPGLIACYDDGLKHPVGAFMPMRCESIRYRGPKDRAWASE